MTAPSPGIISSHHAQRLLRQPRSLSRCDRARDEARNIRRSTRPGLILQIDAPDLAMDRTMMLPRSLRRRVRQALREARRGDQQGHRGHSARARAAACLLRQLGRPAHPRHPARADLAGALPGECRRAVDRILQSAPRPRIRSAQETSAAQGHDPDPRRGRDHQQFRRASGSGGARGSRRRSRRSATASA